MTIENTVKVGDILTAASISIGIIGLFIASLRDRRLRRKEYADRIRQSAAATAVAVERWTELAARLYDDIQALITDTDVLLVEKRDVTAARDFFWRGLVEARATASRRILNEKLDSAYVGLYGYAPDIQALYTSVMTSLKRADEIAYKHLLEGTQHEIMDCSDTKKPYTSAQLGNRLRSKTLEVHGELVLTASSIVDAFRSRMLSVINATDRQIFNKTFGELASTPNHAMQRTAPRADA